MQPSTLLLIASLGAITVLLMMYIYIFMFERRIFLALWFIGWAIIALNYSLDAFLPDLLRQNRWVLFLSLGSYFYANLLISWGTLIFLKFKIRIFHIIGTGMIWLLFFITFITRNWPDLQLIRYTQSAVFALSSLVGAAMAGSAKRYGNFILLLGLLNIAWVVNTIVFSYILEIPQMAPYIVSQMILLLNAIGLVQLFFKEQQDAIKQ